MADNRLEIKGLDTLRADLLKLPSELVDEARVIVHAAAEETLRQTVAATGRVSGNLQEHWRLEFLDSRATALGRAVNQAYHAWLYEHGSAPREWNGSLKNRKRPWRGVRKSTGAMSKHQVLIPIAQRRRQIMEAALVELVERAGLTVTSTP